MKRATSGRRSTSSSRSRISNRTSTRIRARSRLLGELLVVAAALHLAHRFIIIARPRDRLVAVAGHGDGGCAGLGVAAMTVEVHIIERRRVPGTAVGDTGLT